MLDPKWIEENAHQLDVALRRRGLEPQGHNLATQLQQRRILQQEIQAKRERRNFLPEAIGQAKKSQDSALLEVLLQEAAQVKEKIRQLEENQVALSYKLDAQLALLPNVPASDVPDGQSEQDNVVVHTWGEKANFSFSPKAHFELGEQLGLMDFEAARALSGSRFVVLKGLLAKLERILGQFMIDIHTQEFGYTEVSPPLLVREDAMFGTAQFPKFAPDQFQTQDDFWLIPTAEVPLTNLVRKKILEEDILPQRYVALTPCFRRESGAAGKDTRGMVRLHQFSKVELVSIVTPEMGQAEHERLRMCAQTILERLNLPYRIVTLCAGDLGFSAIKTWDLEVWLPFQETYREISSCSLCGNFQARRMMTRIRRADGSLCLAHTLNGSGLAVGRTLIAIVENYQQADGSIVIPEVLRAAMGCDKITAFQER